MGRTPLDSIPQRRLLDTLRVEIPRAMRGDRRATARVRAMSEANARSIRSTHIAYNLGKKKFVWLYETILREGAASAALPPRYDAGSPLVGASSKSGEIVRSWIHADVAQR